MRQGARSGAKEAQARAAYRCHELSFFSRAIVVFPVFVIVGLDRGASCLAAGAPNKTLQSSCHTWH